MDTLKRAGKRALGGGIPGAAAMGIQVRPRGGGWRRRELRAVSGGRSCAAGIASSLAPRFDRRRLLACCRCCPSCGCAPPSTTRCCRVQPAAVCWVAGDGAALLPARPAPLPCPPLCHRPCPRRRNRRRSHPRRGRARHCRAVPPPCTALALQYRYGTTTSEALRTLYKEGGVVRFYRGLLPALFQGPLSRFGDTAANTGGWRWAREVRRRRRAEECGGERTAAAALATPRPTRAGGAGRGK